MLARLLFNIIEEFSQLDLQTRGNLEHVIYNSRNIKREDFNRIFSDNHEVSILGRWIYAKFKNKGSKERMSYDHKTAREAIDHLYYLEDTEDKLTIKITQKETKNERKISLGAFYTSSYPPIEETILSKPSNFDEFTQTINQFSVMQYGYETFYSLAKHYTANPIPLYIGEPCFMFSFTTQLSAQRKTPILIETEIFDGFPDENKKRVAHQNKIATFQINATPKIPEERLLIT